MVSFLSLFSPELVPTLIGIGLIVLGIFVWLKGKQLEVLSSRNMNIDTFGFILVVVGVFFIFGVSFYINLFENLMVGIPVLMFIFLVFFGFLLFRGKRKN